jgi:hypothetical protein
MAEVEPLKEIRVIGKRRRKDEPFPVGGQRGLYFFISKEQFDRLKQINEAHKAAPQAEVKPLEEIKIVGRGGISWDRPFLLRGYPGLYLCILADHLRQLEQINRTHAELLEAKGLGVERKLEEERAGEIEVGEAEKIEVVERVPEEGRYVYCIIPWGEGRSQLSLGNLGIESSGKVYAIPCGDIAAVVSNAPFKEYVLTEDNVRTHNQLITLVMEEHPVVPMAFGMAFKNEEVLKGFLERMRGDLKKALWEVEGKVELGVKVIKPKGAEFDEDAFASEIKALRELAAKSKLGKRFSKRLVLNAFYLVAKEKVEAFLGAANALEEKFKQLRVQCTGPWPPFNFATIKVGGG